MRGLLRKFPIILLVILLTVQPISAKSFDSRIADILHGGAVATKSKSIWQLYKYKHVNLLRKEPMLWCPSRAFFLVSDSVQVYSDRNMHWIRVNGDLANRLAPEARANRLYATQFRTVGNNMNKVWQIYQYCKRTKYVLHVKYASDAFTKRQGDCAAISAAFYVLCKAKHIPVRYVIGWEPNGCHAWNRVKIRKRWYWIDCTHGLWLSRKQYANRTILEMW